MTPRLGSVIVAKMTYCDLRHRVTVAWSGNKTVKSEQQIISHGDSQTNNNIQ